MFVLFVMMLLAAELGHSSVIGIDFGVDWFKVSIVKPGIPLDIVLNAESKRKTSSAIAIHRGERIYGGSARWPSKVSLYLTPGLTN